MLSEEIFEGIERRHFPELCLPRLHSTQILLSKTKEQKIKNNINIL